MKFTFLSVNSSYSHSSAALPLLHTACRNLPIKWQKVDTTINDRLGNIVKHVIETDPDIIGATLYLFNRDFTCKLLSRIAKLLPRCHIILGGPECNGNNQSLLREAPWNGTIIRGEGEAALPILLERIISKKPFDDIPGLCRLNSNGSYQDNGTAIVKDLNAFPNPFESEFTDWSRPFVQLETSRGCIGSCTFCCSGGKETMRTYEISRVEAMLKIISRKGIREIRVLDRTFDFSPQRTVALLQLFRHQFPHLRFHLEIHPSFLTESIRRELRKFKRETLHIEAGVQTFSQQALELCNRNPDIQKVKSGLTFLCEHPDIEVHTDLIAGLPGATLSDVYQDILELVEHAPDEIQLETLKILKGTELAQNAQALGIRHSDDPPFEVLQTPTFSFNELQETERLSKVIDGYYNNELLRTFFRTTILENPEFLKTFIHFSSLVEKAEFPWSIESRIKLLAEYFLHKNLSEHYEKICVFWIKNGFSTKTSLGKGCRRCREIPEKAERISGDEPQPDRNTQIHCLQRFDNTYWFVFNRSIDRRKAQTVYRMPQPASPPKSPPDNNLRF